MPNTFQMSSHTRTDAMVSYTRGSWTAQLDLLNVFDRTYYTGGSASVFNYTVTPSTPAMAQLTLPTGLLTEWYQVMPGGACGADHDVLLCSILG
ncbi:hypothetical protein [Xanthomonas axonopodis]